jgi:hypothetical protein
MLLLLFTGGTTAPDDNRSYSSGGRPRPRRQTAPPVRRTDLLAITGTATIRARDDLAYGRITVDPFDLLAEEQLLLELLGFAIS